MRKRKVTSERELFRDKIKRECHEFKAKYGYNPLRAPRRMPDDGVAIAVGNGKPSLDWYDRQ